jgi:hypothetical protein
MNEWILMVLSLAVEHPVLEAYYLLPFNVRSGMCGTYFHTPTFL